MCWITYTSAVDIEVSRDVLFAWFPELAFWSCDSVDPASRSLQAPTAIDATADSCNRSCSSLLHGGDKGYVGGFVSNRVQRSVEMQRDWAGLQHNS